MPTIIPTLAPTSIPILYSVDLSKVVGATYDTTTQSVTATNVDMFSFPFNNEIDVNETIYVTMKGTYNGNLGFRCWLTNISLTLCSNIQKISTEATSDYIAKGNFELILKYTATQTATNFLFRGPYYGTSIDDLTINSIVISNFNPSGLTPIPTQVITTTPIPTIVLTATPTPITFPTVTPLPINNTIVNANFQDGTLGGLNGNLGSGLAIVDGGYNSTKALEVTTATTSWGTPGYDLLSYKGKTVTVISLMKSLDNPGEKIGITLQMIGGDGNATYTGTNLDASSGWTKFVYEMYIPSDATRAYIYFERLYNNSVYRFLIDNVLIFNGNQVAAQETYDKIYGSTTPTAIPTIIPTAEPIATPTPIPILYSVDLSKVVGATYNSTNMIISAIDTPMFHIPLEQEIHESETIYMTINGTYNGTLGFRSWLSNSSLINCSNIYRISSGSLSDYIVNGDFILTLPYTATQTASVLYFKGASYGINIDNLTINSIKISNFNPSGLTPTPILTATPTPTIAPTDTLPTIVPTSIPTITPTVAPTTSGAITISASTLYASGGVEAVTYQNGGVSFLAKPQYSGGGLMFYINPDKSIVAKGTYNKVKITVSADTPLARIYTGLVLAPTGSFWYRNPEDFALGYKSTSVNANEDVVLEFDLSSYNSDSSKTGAYAIFFKYNAYTPGDDVFPDVNFNIKSIVFE